MLNHFARDLRKYATHPERLLWKRLRDRRLCGYKFRRQHPIGPFVVDFAYRGEWLVVEVDGEQHVESESDMLRTAWLHEHGWRVIRFWNNDILAYPDEVVATILRVLREGTEQD